VPELGFPINRKAISDDRLAHLALVHLSGVKERWNSIKELLNDTKER
jgi:hypothetical protein